MSNLQRVKAIQAVNDDVIIQVGDQIKIWGHVDTVTGFYFTFNEGLMKWETIIMTRGRGGDPLERSLDVIEIDANKPWKSPWETESPSSIEGEELLAFLKGLLRDFINCRTGECIRKLDDFILRLQSPSPLLPVKEEEKE